MRPLTQEGYALMMIPPGMEGLTNPNLPQELPGEAPEPTEGLSESYSPEEVGYRPADSKDQSCSVCVNFTPKAQQAMGAGVCAVVAGSIQPNGVCDLFAGRKGLGSLLGQ